jgi:predicted Fe-Mo cluster-binding NifX family protein
MKILITIQGEQVAPRFDLCSEVLIVSSDGQGHMRGDPRTVLLPGPSSDELCGLAIREEVSLLICGGIEETHYQYLAWKKISVIDRVIGTWARALALALAGRLANGAILPDSGNEDDNEKKQQQQ